MKKCEYCAKEITYFEQYCSDECTRKAETYFARQEKLSKIFTIINTVCVFGIPVGLFLMAFMNTVGAAIALICCVTLGVMLIVAPVPTESMIKKFKLEKAVKFTRIVGALVIALGIIIMLFAVFIL